MIHYKVLFDPLARDEAIQAAEYIARDSPGNAAKWYAGLARTVDALALMPRRYARAPESQTLGQDLRHCIYKSHRIIYRIEEQGKIVRVLHIRHAARRALGELPKNSGE